MRGMNHKSDDKHSLLLEYIDGEDYSLEIVHPQSCSVWWGCDLPRAWRDEKHPFDPCPPYHHAHHRYDCPLGYMVENMGVSDTLFYMDQQVQDESLAVLSRYVGQAVPIHYDFSWGVSGYYEPEYDEELIWEFLPYYTHTWRQDVAICSVCSATKQYVHETNYKCEVPNGQPE